MRLILLAALAATMLFSQSDERDLGTFTAAGVPHTCRAVTARGMGRDVGKCRAGVQAGTASERGTVDV